MRAPRRLEPGLRPGRIQKRRYARFGLSESPPITTSPDSIVARAHPTPPTPPAPSHQHPTPTWGEGEERYGGAGGGRGGRTGWRTAVPRPPTVHPPNASRGAPPRDEGPQAAESGRRGHGQRHRKATGAEARTGAHDKSSTALSGNHRSTPPTPTEPPDTRQEPPAEARDTFLKPRPEAKLPNNLISISGRVGVDRWPTHRTNAGHGAAKRRKG